MLKIFSEYEQGNCGFYFFNRYDPAINAVCFGKMKIEDFRSTFFSEKLEELNQNV